MLFGYLTFSDIRYLQDRSRFRRLKEHAVVLDGTLIHIRRIARMNPTLRYASQPDSRRRYDVVEATYTFTTPAGRRLTRSYSTVYVDLNTVSPHLVGSPVKVLYADDDATMML